MRWMCLLIAVWSAPAVAGSFVVNSTADLDEASPFDGVCETAPGNAECTLRGAITEANSSSESDTIFIPAGTYVLSSPLADLVQGRFDFIGESAGAVVIDGDGTGSVFRVLFNATATFAGMTITGGHTADRGGGIYTQGGIFIEDCVITGNTADLGGGGIHVTQDGQFRGFAGILYSEISFNSALSGGGIQVIDGFDFEAVFLYHSTVSSNTSSAGGAGISHDRSIPGTSVMPQLQANANWWGDPSGPSHHTNPGGTGDSISAEGVRADSWCMDPSCTATASNRGEAQLEVIILEQFDPVTELERLLHTIAITNHGPDEATNVRFWVRPPVDVDYDVSSCVDRLGDLFCPGPHTNIQPGQTFNFQGEVGHDGLVGDYVTEVFAVSDQGDPSTADDTHTETSTVIPAPIVDLELAASAPAQAFVGETLSFEIAMTNRGPDSMIIPSTGQESERGGTVGVLPFLLQNGVPVFGALTNLSAESSDGVCTIQVFDLGGGRVFERADCPFRDLDLLESATMTVRVSALDVDTVRTSISGGAIHVSDPVANHTAVLETEIVDYPCAAPTVEGTAGRDLLFGTSGPDVIAGGEGDDLIFGLGGDDIICAGGGRDIVLAGSGADTVIGEAGNDKLFGGFGDDNLDGGTGSDLVLGGRGQDTCAPDEADLVLCEE